MAERKRMVELNIQGQLEALKQKEVQHIAKLAEREVEIAQLRDTMKELSLEIEGHTKINNEINGKIKEYEEEVTGLRGDHQTALSNHQNQAE